MKLRSGFIKQAVDARRTIGLTQEDAAPLLGVGTSTLQKYEQGEVRIHPDMVCAMSQTYHQPKLRVLYCENECPIGCMEKPCQHAKGIEALMLDLMVMDPEELHNTIRTLHEVLADGVVDDTEQPDVQRCMRFLEELIMQVRSLQLKVRTLVEQGT